MSAHPKPCNYSRFISERAPSYDARHIEAVMRSEHGTLDHLSARDFTAAIDAACFWLDEMDPAQAEALARTYGF
jgi:hypothetical protein